MDSARWIFGYSIPISGDMLATFTFAMLTATKEVSELFNKIALVVILQKLALQSRGHFYGTDSMMDLDNGSNNIEESGNYAINAFHVA